MARNDTVEDCKSRVQIARFEADDFRKYLAMGYLIGAPFWCGLIGAAAWWAWLPPWGVTLLCAGAAMLTVGFIIVESAKRLYVQNAYCEMTLSHLEKEIEHLHDRLGSIEVDLGNLRGEHRPFRL
jgi:hypothetical protein